MNVLFLARSTLYDVFGGDTVQIVSTAKYLRQMGVEADIRLSNEPIDYARYDLIHLFNIIRPADALKHVQQSGLPLVISTIYVDFSEYERNERKGMAGIAAKVFSGNQLEYLKTILRRVKNKERIQSPSYFLLGHKRSVQRLAEKAAILLPNSESEMQRFVKDYRVQNEYKVIPNGIDPDLFPFRQERNIKRDPQLILCVARIEGKKNQLNLIRAVKGADYRLLLVGNPAPNHMKYYEACVKEAGDNVQFEGFIPQDRLYHYYQMAQVHVLPSWNETCGLSSMEAAYYGCNIVITDKGDTRDYYGTHAWYCDPGDPSSIREAITQAASGTCDGALKQKIINEYNWEQAARKTLAAYKEVLNKQQINGL